MTKSSASGRRQSPDSDEPRATSHEKDAELIHRFTSARDEAAFREVVRRYSRLVLSVALRTTHDRQASEDVLQATFLVLVEKADSLDDPSQLAAWLHGVAQRIARRLVDKRHRHREQPHRKEGILMDPHELTDPFERVCQTRDHDVLGEELQRLPAKYRTPLVLRYLDGLTNEQVAERLGMNVSSVEGRLKRGKRELRRRLGRRGVTLGAAMLVWNLTQQSLEAAAVSDLTNHIATTALAWQSPTPALSPPTEPAITLAQQEILAMSTLKLTVASTLVGTTLLVTGLLVATSDADEGTAAELTAAPTERDEIDTSLAESDDEQQPEASVELPIELPRLTTRIFTLKYIDPEETLSVLRRVYGSDGPLDAKAGNPQLRFFSVRRQGNNLIVSARSEQIDEIGNLLQKMEEVVVNALRKRIDDAGHFLNEFDESTERKPVAPADDDSITAVDATEADDSTPLVGLYGNIRAMHFRPKHVDARSAAKLLIRLINTEGHGIAGIGSGETLVLWTDDRTNTVIAAGKLKQLEVVGKLLLQLDQILKPGSDSPDRERHDWPVPYVIEDRPQDENSSFSQFDLTKRSPAEQKIRQALQTTTVPAFDDLPLYNAIYMLAEEHNFQFYIDEAALDSEGISLHEAPVTLNLSNPPSHRDDVTVESVLELLFRQAAGADGALDDSDLTYLVKDGLLIITTREVAEQTMEVRTYNLRPFNKDGNRIQNEIVVEAIRTMAGELTWVEKGGRGSIVQGADTLTIRQSPLVHREIESLLEQLLYAAEQSGESSY